MARRHVTVALACDGGYELFGGYSRYFRAHRWWEKRQSVPGALRGPMAAAARMGRGLIPASHARDQMDKLTEVLGAEHRSEEHTSELQSLMRISYAVFCLKKKNHISNHETNNQLQHDNTAERQI